MLDFAQEELSTQYERYYRTRYGKIVAILIYYLLFTYIPKVLEMVIPELALYVSPEYSYLIILISAITIVTIFYFTSMYFIYTKKIEFFEQYRVNRNKPWPWEENPSKWSQLFWRSIKTTAFYIWIVTPVLIALSTKLEFYIIMDMSLAPTFLQVLPQFILMHFLEDLIFFTSHWALHLPFLYKFHKIHHEYNTTVVTAGLYSHIIEYLLSNSVSAGIYMKIASLYYPMHLTTATIWVILRMWDGYTGHSGYVFSWTPQQLLPFCANDDFHDFHHSHNCGNYSSQFRYLDTIFGTNKPFKQYKKALKAKAMAKAKEQ